MLCKGVIQESSSLWMAPAVFVQKKSGEMSLRGRKCHIAMSQVPYLGHAFSGTGMSPNQQKIAAVKDWPMP